MKRLWFAVVFLVVAGSLSTIEVISVQNDYYDFIDTVDRARLAVMNSDYEKADKISEKMKEDWYEKEKHLNYFLEHSSLDEVGIEIAGLTDYTDDLSRNEFLSVTDKIKRQFASLYRSELPYGENIF